MSIRMDTTIAGPMVVFVLSVMFAAAVWVYTDAKTHAGQGSPIAVSIGSLRLHTPVAWFLACLILGELFIPIYVESRGLA
ncbi:MAG: hypothetical protein QOD10_5548 [Mycobacterium sp.]|nr:hypothetical protein [Mycobacterium sp.]MDT5347116.1 hypothetical protein [Mycobacterium sp.]